MQHETAALIDSLLDQHRPDRYDVGDTSWREPVYSQIATRVTIGEARQIAASYLVDQREGQATKQANALLRSVGQTKQWPLDWMDVGRRPIAVGSARVRLDAARSEDFRQFEVEERRRAAADFMSRNQTCDGAQWLADEMDAHGWVTFTDGAVAHLGGAA